MEYMPSTQPGFTDEHAWQGIENISGKHTFQGSDYYFDSYAHYGIHQDMIKDSVRTGTYKNAIMRNSFLFHNKVVLDVGCGTGILSFFAVRAGARHVYGVDFADIVDYASLIARQNNLQDKVTFYKSKIQDVELPQQVDIIISEWMGYFLLYQSMLDSVLVARDRFLKPGGKMFPNRARLWIAAVQDAKYKYEKIDFWTDIYGINMTAMRSQALREPITDLVPQANIVSSMCPILDIDLEIVQKAELTFVSGFSLHMTRNDTIHALVGWFQVGFFHCHRPIVLSTSPKMKETHWKQVVFYLENAQPVSAGQTLKGSIAVRPNPEHPRELDVKISFHMEGEHDFHSWQFYRLR